MRGMNKIKGKSGMIGKSLGMREMNGRKVEGNVIMGMITIRI